MLGAGCKTIGIRNAYQSANLISTEILFSQSALNNSSIDAELAEGYD